MGIKLLQKKKLGRPPDEPGNPKEFKAVMKFFKDRSLGCQEISKAMDLSNTVIYRWWRTGQITAKRLTQLTQLISQIEAWEQVAGCKFGEQQD
jgi:DNA invertase Pin-like site-specific DNA recombinase